MGAETDAQNALTLEFTRCSLIEHDERDSTVKEDLRTLLFEMVLAAGKMSEVFVGRPDSQPGLPGWEDSAKEAMIRNLAGLLVKLTKFADFCGIDLGRAAIRKMDKNRRKYPAHLVKGSSKKYNEYKMQFQDACPSDETVLRDIYDTSRTHFEKEFTYSKAAQMMADFAAERNWDQFHQPRNLALALIGEIGELAEIFQWKNDRDILPSLPGWELSAKVAIGEEMSDILFYSVRLAARCHCDLDEAIRELLNA